jgi:hypothetical protein
MLPYPVWQLSRFLTDLRDLEWDLKTRPSRLTDEIVERLRNKLSEFYGLCKEINLVATLDVISNCSNRLRNRSFRDSRECGTDLRFIHETVRSELKRQRFVYIPPSKVTLLDDKDDWWREVVVRFPSTKDDIDGATECYVFGCNTGCVFHSMRIAERGLRILALALDIKTTGKQKHPLEFSEWGHILNALKARLNSVQESPGRNAEKAARAKFYADAASQADYLNEIWRKEVSHARGPYNSPEALNALERTRDFMRLLSKYLSEDSSCLP